MSQLLLNLHRYDKDGKPVSLIPIVGLTLFSKIYSFSIHYVIDILQVH